MLNTLRVIGLLQMGGAACCAWLCLAHMIPAAGLSVYVLALIVFIAISVISGIGLWRGSRRAIRWAMFIQAMQVPFIAHARFEYDLISGMGYIVGVGSSDRLWRFIKFFAFDYKWISGFPNPGDGTSTSLGVNLVAVLAVVALIFHEINIPKKKSSTVAEKACPA